LHAEEEEVEEGQGENARPSACGSLDTNYAWQRRELEDMERELNDNGTSLSCPNLSAAQEVALDVAFRLSYPMPGGARRRHETAAALRQWFRNRRMFFNYAGSCTKMPDKVTPSVAKAKFNSWMLFRKK
jgi:hypothetical protein